MSHCRTHPIPATQQVTRSSRSSTWKQTVSGVTVLTVGLQGAAANAVSAPVKPFSESADQLTAAKEVAISVSPVEPAAPTVARPLFSQLKSQVQGLLQTEPPLVSQTVVRLESHQRALQRHANDVEAQLLSVQDLLSIQAYGTSFADRLLEQDQTYQSKLQQLQTLEAELHAALEQADPTTLAQLNRQFQILDQQLRQMAQQILVSHMDQVQRPSTASLWQEPLYRESLRWLMDYTHERHLVQARQQTLAHTLVALAVD